MGPMSLRSGTSRSPWGHQTRVSPLDPACERSLPLEPAGSPAGRSSALQPCCRPSPQAAGSMSAGVVQEMEARSLHRTLAPVKPPLAALTGTLFLGPRTESGLQGAEPWTLLPGLSRGNPSSSLPAGRKVLARDATILPLGSWQSLQLGCPRLLPRRGPLVDTLATENSFYLTFLPIMVF